MAQKLPVREKVGYALGDMAANFVFQFMIALQLDFYTHTFGLTPAQAGTMLGVVGLGVAVLNPVMGVVADRTTSKWGKFRPWILWSALPFGIIGVLTFTTPDLSLGAKVIYAWVTYTALRVVYIVNNVPYASLMAVMPYARLIAVDQAGHLPQWERPDIVQPAIVSFLREVAP